MIPLILTHRFIYYYYYWSLLYSTILHSQADSLRLHVILHGWTAFYSGFFEYPPKWCTLQHWRGWCHKNLLPSQCVLCTPYNHAPCRFVQSHIRKVYACLAVTCHLHFWQNDRDLLHATVVTQGWNGYRNKSQHRTLTLEKKILPPLQQGFEPATFQSRVRRSNHWAIPAPFINLSDPYYYHLLTPLLPGVFDPFSACVWVINVVAYF